MSNKKKLWQYPWEYKESFIISFIITITGIAIELLSGSRGVSIPAYPYNLIIGISFATILLLLQLYANNQPVVKWLSSVPVAISSISVFALLSLLLGFIPQNSDTVPNWVNSIGFSHLSKSLAFVFAQIFLLTNLGLISIRRIKSFSLKNLGFIFNHVGLWIILVASSLGTGDLERLTMQLHKGTDYDNIAYSSDYEWHKLPFYLQLKKFEIEEYLPQIVLVNNKTADIITDKGAGLTEAKEGIELRRKNWNIRFVKFLPAAKRIKNIFLEDRLSGATPALYVEAENTEGIKKKGWISCGSFMYKHKKLKLSDKYSIGMLAPKAKKYKSLIKCKNKENEEYKFELNVNKPKNIAGWNIYLISYDTKKGKWSQSIIIELVKDPWLLIVYFGIFMMFAGAVYILFAGKSLADKNEDYV